MRIYAILASDRANSIPERLINKAIDVLKQEGHQIDFLDLYSRYKEIPFYFSPKKNVSDSIYPSLNDFPFFEENKKRFMEADRILLSYPIYWYSPPGIMKCWLDLITNFAWKYEGHSHAQPLHNIKKTLALTTSHSSTWYLKYILLNCPFTSIKQTFRWMGIPKNYIYNVGNTQGIKEDKIKKHLENVEKLTKKLI